MVKSLRNKFVIVTTLLMLSLFGGFWVVNTIYTNYWNEVEIVEMLEWIGYSGIFTSNQVDYTSEALIRDITKDESPIAGVVLNTNGEIVYTRVIGTEKKITVPDTVVSKMYLKKNSKRRIGKYYYSYSNLNNETILLVIMKSSMDKFNGSKIMGICILILAGCFALVGITFWLSRFVTKPAELTLLREKQFISDAGHELKTPLGAISINAQALEMEYKDDIYIKNIISESNRMGRLLEKLLVLAKLDEQESESLKKINLSDICEEMALTYESIAFEKRVKFLYEVTQEVYIWGNADELRQLVAILIDNAVKNTESGGCISLKCLENKKAKEIRISNTGKGIPEDILPHIFERFYTSDESRSEGSFGLGLAIAKTIVEHHKGSIKAESILNEKTIFRVTF